MFVFYIAPRNRFSLDRWRIINALHCTWPYSPFEMFPQTPRFSIKKWPVPSKNGFSYFKSKIPGLLYKITIYFNGIKRRLWYSFVLGVNCLPETLWMLSQDINRHVTHGAAVRQRPVISVCTMCTLSSMQRDRTVECGASVHNVYLSNIL